MVIENKKPHGQSILIQMAIAVVVLMASVCLWACERKDRKPAGPIEKATLAYSATHHVILAEVAQVKDYFKQEGLEIMPHLHAYGKPALQDMMAGTADFATVAETPVMFAILDGAEISIIATIHKANKDNNAIVARKDKGILTPPDLKGKKIATTLGTVSEFFLDAFLAINSISKKDVELVNLRQEELPRALMEGNVDAAAGFNPFLTMAQGLLGEGGTTFYNKNIYTQTFIMVSTKEFVRHNPGKVEKMLRALDRAEKFVQQNPEEALKIVADFNPEKIAATREMLAGSFMGLSLDQSLILALEDESRWAIKSGLTSATEVPNFLDYIYFDGLKSVRPAAIWVLK
ncbi:MAG: NrtA/SsuA/CpmA family ABC transporter substrate-binding protein [Pseudomonadota bacterium]